MNTDRLPAVPSFGELDIDANRQAMLARARAIVKNAADAEDVVQEALERAWRARDRFMEGADARPWLLKITTNAAIDLLHRKSADAILSDAIVSAKAAPPPETAALRREAFDSLAAALENLAPAQRKAFVLHDVHGYSSREISARQQLPYHTVRTHLFRARRELRRALAGAES